MSLDIDGFEEGKTVPTNYAKISFKDLLSNSNRTVGDVAPNGQCHIFTLSAITGKEPNSLKDSIKDILLVQEKEKYILINMLEQSRAEYENYVNVYSAHRPASEKVPKKYWGSEITTSAAALVLKRDIVVVDTRVYYRDKRLL